MLLNLIICGNLNIFLLWLNGHFNFSTSRMYGVQIEDYNFGYTSNEQERYFTYFVDEWKMIIFLLKIVLDGCLEYDNELALLCHSLGSCENDEIPICRNGVPFFQHRTGLMSEDGFKFKESDNMTFEECSVVFLFYIL
ncbi:hypothetical protein ACOSQ3_020832 [Xanthoceras sorbifolium]